MKKILLAFDGSHFPKSAFEFACQLNEIQPIFLTGAFLPRVDISASWSYAPGGGSSFIPTLETHTAEQIERNVKTFELECIRRNIEYRVHRHPYEATMPELKKETRFADLLILDSEKFYEDISLESPNEYLRMIIHDAECPVLLVPELSTFPESIILAYDGSENAAFAIKNFYYLFPELSHKKTILVHATTRKKTAIPALPDIAELVTKHFSDLTIHTPEAIPEKHFETWLAAIKSPLLVCGSFARSELSQLFKKSFVTEILNEHKVPVFIAHR
ncbi:hypothetical protein [Chitinophaga defluvii]|uniref:Universal stress protein family protein n=1 Tax=Chitinophaga defluvii TaxID=3163343 RepID=A0ABV2T3D1_9BACT